MTDDRHKSTGGQESVARTTARDVPFMRGDSEMEPAPRGKRPAQLPRDPTYEEELAQVELAVLRDPVRRDDPSTKQGGRNAQYSSIQPPESVTPESPVTRPQHDVNARSPHPPSSNGRAVASGTLLSVGSVDPRGKTERTLETPRMFFSRTEQAEAYFKPGAIPAVTVHQTLETETVKLSDSIDPRRAKTIPRLDRAALARLAELETVPESAAPVALAGPGSSLDLPASDASMRWNQQEYDAEPRSYSPNDDGQIHASLSPFREQVESDIDDYDDGVPTRAEPLAARRSDQPPSISRPDPSAVPTQRDLPMHRIEASMPPPPPAGAPISAPRSAPNSAVPQSEGPSPTTASIAAEEPQRRPAWINYAAFVAALVLAVVLGLWLTRTSGEANLPEGAPTKAIDSKPIEPPPLKDVAPQTAETASTPVERVKPAAPVDVPPRADEARKTPVSTPATTSKLPVTSTPASAPRKSSSPKTTRESIF